MERSEMLDKEMNEDIEQEYNWIKDIVRDQGSPRIGVMSAGTWLRDPKRLGFVLSRYKFVAKMFSGFDRVLELGSADGWPSRIVKQEVKTLVCVDFDQELLDFGINNVEQTWPILFEKKDLTELFHYDTKFDGVFALDVLEHIDKEKEDLFMKNIVNNLLHSGVTVIGIPSLESQVYSYPDNGHVNCKSGEELREFCLNYFERVLIFSMNDEVVHTGFVKMANYLFAVCFYPKVSKSI
jgi:2-polyprenyl-3-methyl-5-hydroxy-6-metoxy-1,4-benzoquinol methylase